MTEEIHPPVQPRVTAAIRDMHRNLYMKMTGKYIESNDPLIDKMINN